MNDMQKDFNKETQHPHQEVEDKANTPTLPQSGKFNLWINRFLQMGLGEPLVKIGTNLLSVGAIVVVILLARSYFQSAAADKATKEVSQETVPLIQEVDVNNVNFINQPLISGISRAAQLHTIVPSRPRNEIITYDVVEGDTVFDIAEKFGLEPQTILWGNYNVLLDDPHSLKPGQELNILPVNGVYWEWLGGISFSDWAKFYGVTAADIIEYPGNKLDPNSVGDYNNPNIKTGTWLIIPGGSREFVNWSAPLGVTRENPASARVLGQGSCDPVSGGAVGYGTYVYPTNKHYLSGFDFNEKTNHRGIDLAGSEGEGVYATDAGVVVYSGWNDYGYGNMIMIDHGDGFQSLYAHLSAIYRGCGASVGQGETIGAVGTTGRSSGAHLHFELMTMTWKVNPWDYLPPP